MSDDFYMLVYIIVLACTITKEIYSFGKGRYNPYMFSRRGKSLWDFIAGLALAIFTVICLINIDSAPLTLYIFSAYSFCLALCIGILNCLSYRKIRDRKIIYQTILFITIEIVVLMLLWKSLMR